MYFFHLAPKASLQRVRCFSCMPNVSQNFKLASFSVQFCATRDISAGQQLFHSYCPLDESASERQAYLAPYGFTCKCPACVNATPKSDTLRKTFFSGIKFFNGLLEKDDRLTRLDLEAILLFEQDLIKEGLHGLPQVESLLITISTICSECGMTTEAEKYRVLIESYKSRRLLIE